MLTGFRRAAALVACVAAGAMTAACTTGSTTAGTGTTARGVGATTTHPAPGTTASPGGGSSASRPADGSFTITFAGDVHFSGRVRKRLLSDPASAFGVAEPGLRRADLTMVNLETAITTGGVPQPKEYHFRAPASALTALRDAGIDVATEANNHGADYGNPGLRDTLAAIAASHFPVIGIGRDEDEAFAPYRTTLHGTKVAIFAADQVQDETTLRLFSAGPDKAGVANAFYPRLIDEVRQARAQGYAVVVYLHWGVELQTCPSPLQHELAAKLANAGATAVIGTHAHVLQGEGWRPDGTYVAYGLGNYLWWESYHNNQDDNGLLTLTFRGGSRPRVIAAHFAPSHLARTGVPVPSTGAQARRIDAEVSPRRACVHLDSSPPS